MIDWSVARRVAATLAGTPPPGRLPADLPQRADGFAQRITDYTHLTPARELPPLESVDREEWIAVNQASMRPLLELLADRVGADSGPLSGAARTISGLALGAQVGFLTGILSQRVLGQYDIAILDGDAPRRLLLVAPNLNEAAGRLSVDGDELASWVAVHELTHAVQFESVPWLRAHLAEMVRELLEDVRVDVSLSSLLRYPSGDAVRELVEAARRGDLLRLVMGPRRHATMERIQAVMSLIEGHAEHVMDAVGAELLPDMGRLRRALDRRRQNRTPFWRLLEKLLGLEMKLRQYEEGRRFCDAVVGEAGIDALNRAWSAPELLPTLDELRVPAGWLARVGERGHAAPAA